MIFALQNNHHNQVKKNGENKIGKSQDLNGGIPFMQNKWIKVRNETSLISFGRYTQTHRHVHIEAHIGKQVTHRHTGTV